MLTITPSWLPQYKIIRHRRARSVKFRITSTRELKITIPYRFSVNHLPSILEEHREWILSQINKTPIWNIDNLPTMIELNAINQSWRVIYMNNKGRLRLYERPQNELIVFGENKDNRAYLKLLMKWLKHKANLHFSITLQTLSLKANLPFSKLTIRSQTTLWGSCTSSHAISLNYKLIFLPAALAEHVMLHELCHTKHLNHSQSFWTQLEKLDPQSGLHTKLLRKADQHIPTWINFI